MKRYVPKPGHRLRCINAGSIPLTVGQIYTVASVQQLGPEPDDALVELIEVCGELYALSRFVPHQDNPDA